MVAESDGAPLRSVRYLSPLGDRPLLNESPLKDEVGGDVLVELKGLRGYMAEAFDLIALLAAIESLMFFKH